MSANPESMKPAPRPNAEDLRQDALERQRRIAEVAYYRAERRGFEPGHEQEDWLEAECEIDGDSRGQAGAIETENQDQ